MMIMCNDIVIIEFHAKRSGLPSAPLDMEYGNITNRGIAIALNI